MNQTTETGYIRLSPELEALQFERLVEIYVDLGLKRAQAAAAAQADYLCGNVVAFRRRDPSPGSYLLIGLDREAA